MTYFFRFLAPLLFACCPLIAPYRSVASIVVNYRAPITNQTASARYSFLDADTLIAVLSETTPVSASPLIGNPTILTALGVRLDGAEIRGGSVRIGSSSRTVRFDQVINQLGSGTDISSEWGFSAGPITTSLRNQSADLRQQADVLSQQAIQLRADAAKNLESAKEQRDAAAQLLSNNPDAQQRADAFDLIRQAEALEFTASQLQSQANSSDSAAGDLLARASTLDAQADALPDYNMVGVLNILENVFLQSPPADNLTGPVGLGGADGGLLADSDASNGIGVVDDTVIISLDLTAALTDSEQTAFLNNIVTESLVVYGSAEAQNALSIAGVDAVPAPASSWIWGINLIAGGVVWRFLSTRKAKRLASATSRLAT